MKPLLFGFIGLWLSGVGFMFGVAHERNERVRHSLSCRPYHGNRVLCPAGGEP
jgi:hypothetical protein